MGFMLLLMHHSVSQTREKITVMFTCCLWIPQTIRRLKVRCYSSQSANTHWLLEKTEQLNDFCNRKSTRAQSVWALDPLESTSPWVLRIVIWLKKLYTRGPLVVEVCRESRPSLRGSGPRVPARSRTCWTVHRVTATRKPTGHSGWIRAEKNPTEAGLCSRWVIDEALFNRSSIRCTETDRIQLRRRSGKNLTGHF